MGMTVDDILAKTEEAPVLFMTFADKVAKYGDEYIYCFVEDYDMPYYSSPIKVLTSEKWTSIRCKGKEKVLAIHDYIKTLPNYRGYQKRYFVDRDFDDNSSLDDDIYVTPTYSIENFYASEDCMKQVLETEYEVDPVADIDLFNKTIGHYRSKQQEYHKATLLYNAWYACLHDEETWSHDKICLDDKFPKKLLKYKIANPIVATYTLTDIETLHKGLFHIEQDVVASKSAMLAINPTANLRGKYEIEFVCNYIKFLNDDAGSKTWQYTKKKKNFTFGDDVVLTAMSQYADIPNGLKDYIKTGKRTIKD